MATAVCSTRSHKHDLKGLEAKGPFLQFDQS